MNLYFRCMDSTDKATSMTPILMEQVLQVYEKIIRELIDSELSDENNPEPSAIAS
jgi:hypothetical protein